MVLQRDEKTLQPVHWLDKRIRRNLGSSIRDRSIRFSMFHLPSYDILRQRWVKSMARAWKPKPIRWFRALLTTKLHDRWDTHFQKQRIVLIDIFFKQFGLDSRNIADSSDQVWINVQHGVAKFAEGWIKYDFIVFIQHVDLETWWSLSTEFN